MGDNMTRYRDELPHPRPGIYRFKVLAVPHMSEQIVKPLLPAIQRAYDLKRLRTGWSPSHWKTVDTLHVTTYPVESIISHGYGNYVITLQEALERVKKSGIPYDYQGDERRR